MKVIKGFESIKTKFDHPILTIGNFDGIHLGHQDILKKMQDAKEKIGGTSIVYTFEPHPLNIVSGIKRNFVLTPGKEKLSLMADYGVDVVIVENFNKDFAKISRSTFLEDILFNRIGVKKLFVGYDFSFGFKGLGDLAYLESRCQSQKVKLTIIEPFKVSGEVLSTSLIRTCLKDGKIEEVSKFLGRHYSIEGEVIRGNGIGRKIGFPTANIDYTTYLLPKYGVYKANCLVGDLKYQAVVNVGKRPTVKDNIVTFETHILDFDEEIYGQIIKIELINFIREEVKFHSFMELTEQIKKDVSMLN
ncbi:MAG: bifunctional riboflavin kinase/FAD synthetase [Pseudomonadota bacterium]